MRKTKKDVELELITELGDEYAEKAKKHFGPFVGYTMDTYESLPFNIELRKVLNDFAHGKIKKLMIFCPPQHGKLIHSNILIYTTKGVKRHGDLQPGDYVFHPSGKPVKVVATSDETYCDREIEFTNGEVIKTHSNHEWAVNHRSRSRRKGYSTEVLETKQIEKQDYWELQSNGKHRAIYQLPDKDILEFPLNTNLKIDPYLLGVWLGDGKASSPTLTLNKDDFRPIFNKLKSGNHSISIHKESETTQNCYLPDSLEAFKELKLLENKHIPAEYVISSVEQRLELIAGIIDSDGYYHPRTGRYCISNTNKQVIKTLSQILESLNIRTTVAEFKPKLSSGGIQGQKNVYQLTFNTCLDIPCTVSRKRNTNPLKTKRKVGIKHIRKINDGSKGKCIQVDSPDGLYLVGETLIPTHNSQLVSRHLPAFLLGLDPKKRIVGVSYSGDFAKRFSKDARRIITSDSYKKLFPDTRVNTTRKRDMDEAATANLYETLEHHGYHQTVGVGGQLTGVSVDVGIIDDIIKDSVEANSETTRNNHWDWFETVFETRLHNDSQQLITFTRWHEDDLAGRLITRDGIGDGQDGWLIINLPALYEDNDKAWDRDLREIDEPLWPTKHSKERLEKKRDRSPRTFAALYQQRPAPEDGNIINVNDFQYYDPVVDKPRFQEIIQTWDCSFKGTKSSDWVVGQLWGRIGANYYLIDQKRGKWGITMTMNNIVKMTNECPKAKRKVIEDKANGSAVIEILKKHITGLIACTPDIDKEARAKAVAHCVDSHNVYLPVVEKYPWVKTFIEEWRSFPNAAHDDQVDASTQAWHHFEKRPLIVEVEFGSITKAAKYKQTA